MSMVNNRADLEFFFDSILQRNYIHYSEFKKYDYGRNAVKTYIVEVHNFNNLTNSDEIFKSLLLRAKNIDKKSEIYETSEETLLYLTTSDGQYFIDTSSKRFIVIHTANSTKVTDSFIKKFQNSDGYDSLWLPTPLLLKTLDLGRFWGMGVSYKDLLDDSSLEQNDLYDKEDVQDVNLTIKRHYVKDFFKVLMQSELSNMMGISKVAVLRKEEESSSVKKESNFIVDDIRYNGKITAKGNSYSKHSRIVFELVNIYSETIKSLEAYGMSFEGGVLSGNPITINFSKRVNCDRLVNVLFNAEEPFRLWGIPDRIGEGQYRVYAVDMHHGNLAGRLTFEITSSFLRVSLPKYSCANTILRLFANINHYIDAMAELEVVDYELKVDISRAGLG